MGQLEDGRRELARIGGEDLVLLQMLPLPWVNEFLRVERELPVVGEALGCVLCPRDCLVAGLVHDCRRHGLVGVYAGWLVGLSQDLPPAFRSCSSRSVSLGSIHSLWNS